MFMGHGPPKYQFVLWPVKNRPVQHVPKPDLQDIKTGWNKIIIIEGEHRYGG
jgi:hypothetical protein